MFNITCAKRKEHILLDSINIHFDNGADFKPFSLCGSAHGILGQMEGLEGEKPAQP